MYAWDSPPPAAHRPGREKRRWRGMLGVWQKDYSTIVSNILVLAKPNRFCFFFKLCSPPFLSPWVFRGKYNPSVRSIFLLPTKKVGISGCLDTAFTSTIKPWTAGEHGSFPNWRSREAWNTNTSGTCPGATHSFGKDIRRGNQKELLPRDDFILPVQTLWIDDTSCARQGGKKKQNKTQTLGLLLSTVVHKNRESR